MRARLGLERVQALMHRRRAGGAGVLHPRRALEAQVGRGLQHQRGGEILRREAGVEMAEHDLVHVGGRDAGVGQRVGRDPHDQALDASRRRACRTAYGPIPRCSRS